MPKNASYGETQVLAWVDEFVPEAETSADGRTVKMLCPFHDDKKHPNAILFLNTETFKCMACGAKGGLFKLLAGKLGRGIAAVKKLCLAKADGVDNPLAVSQDVVRHFHANLLKSKKHQALLARKGITMATAEEYVLGVDGQRITIPVFDRSGNVVNVRKYMPDARVRKTINMKGHGQAALYPVSALDEAEEGAWICLTEGEPKALLLNQLGLHAVSPTGGASTWKREWNEEFRGRRVAIFFDIDTAGRTQAQKVARNLFPYAKEVRDILIPLSQKEFPKGDVTDWVVSGNAGMQEVRELIRLTTKWEPRTTTTDIIEDETVYEVPLHEASRAEWFGKFVKTHVVVSAKDTAPYIVPRAFQVLCDRDKDYCAFCPVYHRGDGGEPIEVDARRAVVLEMLGASRDKLDRVLRRAASIPQKCETSRFRITDMMNFEELRLVPQLNIGQDHEHVVRRAFFAGHGIETNAPYEVEARVVPEPQTQYATLIVFRTHAAVDSISAFELDEDGARSLKAFRPREWTVESLRTKLDELYADLEANVTRIYQRRDLHLMIDLVYHSVLNIRFQGKVIKGWAEGLILGDSGQGKSEATTLMQRHYGLGEKVETKGATVAGLLGGAQETARRWFITWGVIPLNDRRLVVLEEIKGMDPVVISKLTDMRSSGIAEIVKIESAKTNARCRLIWVSNPRSDRQVMSYNYGVEAVKELMGSLEDVRRFDVAIVVASGEVDRKWLNIDDDERPHVKHRYKPELCQRLLLWAWSRKVQQVKMQSGAVKAVLRHSSELGMRYSSSIPLIEAADQRLKLARLSAALAARTFSASDDGKDVVVRRCHVDFVAGFLDQLYSSPAMGYAAYSRLLRGEEELHDADEVKAKLRDLPHAADTVRALLESPAITVFDLADLTGMELERCRELTGLLVRKNALKRGRRAYTKSPAFIALLKRLQAEGLTNVTEYERKKDEEF